MHAKNVSVLLALPDYISRANAMARRLLSSDIRMFVDVRKKMFSLKS